MTRTGKPALRLPVQAVLSNPAPYGLPCGRCAAGPGTTLLGILSSLLLALTYKAHGGSRDLVPTDLRLRPASCPQSSSGNGVCSHPQEEVELHPSYRPLTEPRFLSLNEPLLASAPSPFPHYSCLLPGACSPRLPPASFFRSPE